MNNSLLQAIHLGKKYKNRPAVQDVSINVRPGEAVGLLGPNGAGKTTCFYMLCGLIKPSYGEIFLDDNNITNLPMYRRARLGICYLPQEPSIFRGMNVEENIMSILELNEELTERRNIELEELLAEFSITHLRHANTISLSGGERRRVEIARTLAAKPRYILLDEPLAGIDPVAVGEVRKMILHLKNRGIGILITDHNVYETLKIIDRAYIIHEGKVLMEGSTKEIVNNSLVKRLYLGDKFEID